jgi:hypothetical protein
MYMYIYSGNSTVKKDTPELSLFTFFYTQYEKSARCQFSAEMKTWFLVLCVCTYKSYLKKEALAHPATTGNRQEVFEGRELSSDPLPCPHFFPSH